MNISSSKGFSLVETMVALGVLTTGVLGTAAVLTTGMQKLSSSPADVVVTQKASEAIEAVFAARDRLGWTAIKNTSGGGVFLTGPQPLKLAGDDGFVNTADDATQPVESVTFPGKDQTLGTSDDSTTVLTSFTREIAIADVAGENGQLRSVVVTIRYQNGPTIRTYTLTTYISGYS
jgi:type II secretory pathway pseudopilin PulG